MLHDAQKQILRNANRFNTVACGRRFGKTTLAIALAAAGGPHIPGAIATQTPLDVGWFAPTYRLLDEAFRSMLRFARAYVVKSNANAPQRIEFSPGTALDFWTLEDKEAGRSRRYGLVIVDEASLSRNLREAWEQAIRPTLSDYRGGAWFFGTPKGRNYFHELYSYGSDPRRVEWASHHAPTAANPFIHPAEIESARRDLPERVFMQEYEAVFLESGGGVFRRVLDAVDDTLPTDPHVARDPVDGRAFVIGVDWARHNDFTVFTVLDAKTRSVVAVDRFTGIEYAVQLARLKALHSRFTNAPIIAESNSMGGPLIEQLRRERLPVREFQTTSASKAAIIESLSLAFEKGELRIPRVQPLIDELLAFDQERLPSGAIRYRAPEGVNDDCVMALAIAWHGLAWGAVKPDYTKGIGVNRRTDGL